MPFGNIVAQTITYEPRKPGIYQAAGTAIGAPTNEFRLSAATPSKGKPLNMAITRVKGKDVVSGNTTVRENAAVTINFTAPNTGSFTAAELNSLMLDAVAHATAANLARQASGEV